MCENTSLVCVGRCSFETVAYNVDLKMWWKVERTGVAEQGNGLGSDEQGRGGEILSGLPEESL